MLVVSDRPLQHRGLARTGERLAGRRRADLASRRQSADRRHRRRRDPQRLRRGDRSAAAAGDRRLRPLHPAGAGRRSCARRCWRCSRSCLNLASVAAAVGVMTLVCKIPEGYPLGGHPYIDTVGAGAIFGVTFGLSIDYAVFLIARMRERYEIDRRQPRGDRLRAREDRRGDHRRRRDHGRRLRLLRHRADRHREPDGRRPDGGDPARRDRGADRPAAGADAAARRPGLARPPGARPHPSPP